MTADDFRMIRTNIALLYKMRDEQMLRLKELKRYDGKILKRISPDNGKHVYYHLKDPVTSIYRYLGTDRNPIVKCIKEVRYTKEFLKRIESNIDILSKMLAGYIPLDYDAINSALPLTYKGAEVRTNQTREKIISDWKADMRRVKASYPIKNPEQLTQTYVDGTLMRSKSELAVASCLDLYKIPYMYEVPIKIDGCTIYPDFRLLSPVDLETVFLLEQFGRMDLENYQESVGWKISKYMKKGFVPNVNFFMCFDDLNGNANLIPLREIILKISEGSSKGLLIA